PTPPKELSVFDAEHPRPKDELKAPELREVMTKASDEQMKKLEPKDAASLAEFKRVVGTALRAMVNSGRPWGTLFGSSTNVHPTKWPGQGEGAKGIVARVATRDARHPYEMAKLF